MQQNSRSKILMGTAMIGFLGFFSSNVAQAVDCESLGNRTACMNQHGCGWVQDSPTNVESGSCVEYYSD